MPRTPGAARAPETPPDTPSTRGAGLRFVVLFLVVLAGLFSLVAWQPVNDRVVVPFTAAIATVSGLLLNLLGQGVVQSGTMLHTPTFAVDIKNGCNGIEAIVIFVAAVAAFPSAARARFIGLAGGFVLIQALNLVRIVTLYLLGAHWPAAFSASHTVVWQAIIILFSVVLWLLWVERYARPQPLPGA